MSPSVDGELKALAEAWIAHFSAPVIQDQDHTFLHRNNSTTEWAAEQALEMVTNHPENLWTFVLEVLQREPPAEVIANLAAGSLEAFLACYGESVIDQVEQQAAADPRFRSLLGGVWQNNMSDQTWARVCGCRDTAGWD